MKKVKLRASFSGHKADGRSYTMERGETVGLDDAEADSLVAAGFAILADSDELFQPAKTVESYQMPPISPGARQLITKATLSDKEILLIVPTGKNGIVNKDVTRYLKKHKQQ